MTRPPTERAKKPGLTYDQARHGTQTAYCYDCGACFWVRTMSGSVRTPVSNPRFVCRCQPCIHKTLGIVEEEPRRPATVEVDGFSFRFR